MFSRFSLVLCGILLALGSFSPAFAQQRQHPYERNSMPVKSVLALPNDAPVRLYGYLERALGDGKYLFRDKTGEIVVELDNDIPHMPDGQWVLIEGEVDKDDSGCVKIKVKITGFLPLKRWENDSGSVKIKVKKTYPRTCDFPPVMTVKVAKTLAKNHPAGYEPVPLIGHIERTLGDKKYLFRDETGKIVLEIDDGLPQPAPGDWVDIEGKVVKNASGSVKFEANYLSIRPRP